MTDEKRVELYTVYKKKYPKSQGPRRLPLNFVEGKFFHFHLGRFSMFQQMAMQYINQIEKNEQQNQN